MCEVDSSVAENREKVRVGQTFFEVCMKIHVQNHICYAFTIAEFIIPAAVSGYKRHRSSQKVT